MSEKGKQIVELVNTTAVAADKMTKPLKAIGDGNMLNGVKNIFNYALQEGEKSGFAKGKNVGRFEVSVVALLLWGAYHFIPKGVSYVKKKTAERKAHTEIGEKIYTAFSENSSDNSSEQIIPDEEEKDIET